MATVTAIIFISNLELRLYFGEISAQSLELLQVDHIKVQHLEKYKLNLQDQQNGIRIRSKLLTLFK